MRQGCFGNTPLFLLPLAAGVDGYGVVDEMFLDAGADGAEEGVPVGECLAGVDDVVDDAVKGFLVADLFIEGVHEHGVVGHLLHEGLSG